MIPFWWISFLKLLITVITKKVLFNYFCYFLLLLQYSCLFFFLTRHISLKCNKIDFTEVNWVKSTKSTKSWTKFVPSYQQIFCFVFIFDVGSVCCQRLLLFFMFHRFESSTVDHVNAEWWWRYTVTRRYGNVSGIHMRCFAQFGTICTI